MEPWNFKLHQLQGNVASGVHGKWTLPASEAGCKAGHKLLAWNEGSSHWFLPYSSQRTMGLTLLCPQRLAESNKTSSYHLERALLGGPCAPCQTESTTTRVAGFMFPILEIRRTKVRGAKSLAQVHLTLVRGWVGIWTRDNMTPKPSYKERRRAKFVEWVNDLVNECMTE